MVVRRSCPETNQNGHPCQSPPVTDSQFCRMHSPEHSAEVAEARRLGGLRRRREVAVSGAYDFSGLERVADIRRILEIAVLDTLGLDNGVSRSRTLAYLAVAAIKLLEVGVMEQRLEALESAVHGPKALPEPVFDLELASEAVPVEVEA